MAATALGIFLTGGASNSDPASSLGGVFSSTRVRGMGGILQVDRIPAVRIDNILPGCGEGAASIHVDANGDLVFTAPDGEEGDPVTVVEGASGVLEGSSRDKAVLVTRLADWSYPLGKNMPMTLVHAMNGVLAQGNLTSAQRAAGRTTYRAIVLSGARPAGVGNIKLWMPPVGGAQATFSLAVEIPSGGALQTIANETTAPTGVSWVTPTTEAGALLIPWISYGHYMGLWIRRVFPPAGTVTPREAFQLSMTYRGV